MLAFVLNEGVLVLFVLAVLLVVGLVVYKLLARTGRFIGKGMSHLEKKWDEEDAKQGKG